MPNCSSKPPQRLLVFGVFAALAVLLTQGAFREEGPLVFSPGKNSDILVEVGQGFPQPGVIQFSDALPLRSVIQLTGGAPAEDLDFTQGCPDLLVSGLQVSAKIKRQKVTQIHCSWMPASHRMALGIPLHPDRMTKEDWDDLPGVGPKLAVRIEMDRQINGEFVRFEALQRVKGVGEKRLRNWEEFF